MTGIEAHLQHFTAAAWSSTLEALLPEMHAVDRDATRIWHAFHPLALADAYAAATDGAALGRRLRLDGNPRLADGQIASSHRFLYGHRYWTRVTTAVLTRVGPAEAGHYDVMLLGPAEAGHYDVMPLGPTEAGHYGVMRPSAAEAGLGSARAGARDASPSSTLTDLVRGVAADVAAAERVDTRLVTGIAFIGLMTLRQVGANAFRASVATNAAQVEPGGRSPEAVVAQRARDDSQGLLGFMRAAKRYHVVFDEEATDAAFPILDGQHLTTASALDGRDYTRGPRRFQEGPIPAQCRSATCSTCWVGVLGGREKLSVIDDYETRRLHEFGYITVTEEKPIIRLACQARASGNVTIVIPPWHGLVSRLQPTDLAASTAGEH